MSNSMLVSPRLRLNTTIPQYLPGLILSLYFEDSSIIRGQGLMNNKKWSVGKYLLIN